MSGRCSSQHEHWTALAEIASISHGMSGQKKLSKQKKTKMKIA